MHYDWKTLLTNAGGALLHIINTWLATDPPITHQKDWLAVLQTVWLTEKYDVDLVNALDELEGIYPDCWQEVLKTKWFGFAPASVEAIEATEKRLGISLPSSYRQFLLVSNGWTAYQDFPYYLTNLLQVEKIDWFTKLDDVGRIDGYKRFIKETPQDDDDNWNVPLDQLEQILMIGESDGNECLLLNPAVKSYENECEAWQYHNEMGFERWGSFWDLIHVGNPSIIFNDLQAKTMD